MPIEFLDTNLIIRYLVKDNYEQAQRAYRFLQEVESGLIQITTSEAVIAEAVYVLSSKALYNLPRQIIQSDLAPVISLKGLKLPHKKTYLRALELYATINIDFVDALNVAHMERTGITTILSFDKDYDRVPGITRREP